MWVYVGEGEGLVGQLRGAGSVSMQVTTRPHQEATLAIIGLRWLEGLVLFSMSTAIPRHLPLCKPTSGL